MPRLTGAVCLLALAGSAVLVSCGSDDPFGPNSREQDGFTVSYTVPFMVNHVNTITIPRHFSADASAPAGAVFDTPEIAAVDGYCQNSSTSPCASAYDCI